MLFSYLCLDRREWVLDMPRVKSVLVSPEDPQKRLVLLSFKGIIEFFIIDSFKS